MRSKTLVSSRSTAGGGQQHRGLGNPQQPERVIIMVMLLLIAWLWIMVTVGMVFYHGYYSRAASMTTLSHQHHHLIPLPGVAAEAVNDQQPSLTNMDPPAQQQREGGEGNNPQLSAGRLRQGLNATTLQPQESPLLIITCNRDNYLKETLANIQKYIPHDCTMGCPVIISQDGNNPNVKSAIQDAQVTFQAMGIPLIHLQHPSALRGGRNAYQALAVHYGWALAQVFDGLAMTKDRIIPQRVLILEEDINVSVDFFSYFAAMAPILDHDRTLLAISAFNDNGFRDNVKEADRVLRSDFFPGLGWMLRRDLWVQELSIKWPTGYWDDWLREPAQRQDRHIVRPEISRTYHFGSQGGASGNQFGDKLSKVYLNTELVDWSHVDFSGLQLSRYDQQYWLRLTSCTRSESITEALEMVKENSTRLEYTSWDQFQKFAHRLSLMDDEKATIPRTGYRGVVEARPYGDHILYISPPMKQIEPAFATQFR